MKKVVHVVGAVILEDGKVLCAQRGSKDKVLPSLWEFPGGKIEGGESAQEALKREIKEEMQCDVEVGEQVDRTVYDYDFATVDLTTFYCKVIKGKPTLTEHERMVWLAPSELRTLPWAPADIPSVSKVERLLKTY